MRPSNKLNHVKIRPFKIIRNIKETSFELKLPKGMQWRHSVFYIFLLKSAPVEVPILTQVPDNYLMKQEEWYEIEWILKHKDINHKWHYLVKWKEYPNSENMWEPIMNLNNCKQTIEKYLWEAHSQARTTDQSQQELQPGQTTHSKGTHSRKAPQLPQKPYELHWPLALQCSETHTESSLLNETQWGLVVSADKTNKSFLLELSSLQVELQLKVTHAHTALKLTPL